MSCLLVVREPNEHHSTRKVFSVLQESRWMRMQGKDTRKARYAVGYGRYMYIAISSGRASLEWQHSPDIEYPDIFNYFVATLSLHTQQQLKAYRPQNIQVLHRRLGTATHGLTRVADSFCECFTQAVTIYEPGHRCGEGWNCHTCMLPLYMYVCGRQHASILELSFLHWKRLPS